MEILRDKQVLHIFSKTLLSDDVMKETVEKECLGASFNCEIWESRNAVYPNVGEIMYYNYKINLK